MINIYFYVVAVCATGPILAQRDQLRSKRMNRIYLLTIVLSFMLLYEGAASAQVINVSHANMNGWTINDQGQTAHSEFVTGPLTAPIGTGSFRETLGSGNDKVRLYTEAYNGLPLTDITQLTFDTYVTQHRDAQAVYLEFYISSQGNGVFDDVLKFEPVYQNGSVTGAGLPNEGALTTGVWQPWNAMIGGWWSRNGTDPNATPGDGVKTLSSILSVIPNAALINYGISFTAGSGVPSWDNFDGNVDDFTIGTVNGGVTTYNLDPKPDPPAVPEPCAVSQLLAFEILVVIELTWHKSIIIARRNRQVYC